MPTPQERWDEVFLSGKDFALMNEQFLDAKILPKVHPSKRADTPTALDLGCGTGDLLAKLVARGFHVDGVDASAVALESARDRLGADVGSLVCADLDGADLSTLSPQYDLVSMKLVLAFVHERARLLDTVRSKIIPTGVFVLITPIITDTMSVITPKAQAISISEDEVEKLLTEHFTSWERIGKEDTPEGLVLATYLAYAE